jgi:hypothetical protein
MHGVPIVEPDTARSGYNPAWACPQSPPIPLSPGASRIDTFQVTGPTIRDGRTNEPVGVLDGTFRLSYVGRSSPDVDSSFLPPPQTQSNSFTVRIEE